MEKRHTQRKHKAGPKQYPVGWRPEPGLRHAPPPRPALWRPRQRPSPAAAVKRHPLPCLAALLMALADGAAAGPLVLEQGTHSGIAAQRFATVRDQPALRALWREHGKGAAPPPEVDFDKERVVAAFAGQKSTGGYQLNFVGLGQGKKRVEVGLSLTQPAPDCLVAQTPTQPYVILKIPRTSKTVGFQLALKTFSCVTGNPL